MDDARLAELAAAAREGDDRALGALVRATQDDLVRLCAHLGSPTDSEDIAKDTNIRAIDAHDRYRGDAPFRAWLFGIARHVCADHVRRHVRRRRLDALRPPRREHAAAPDEQVEAVEEIEDLDPDQRSAFVLTVVMGLEYAEAAAVCGCPVGTIRSRVNRARDRLRVL
ncbi:MAG: sigma-70 family RNA polymerase sigma factor, partial [Actinomycetota bacterium]